ncbi:MAG TPA: ABC transporter permease subunit [Planctomycetota bacterium]|nr:ABC transporter permease subunit [Planctomycetota bacterium]HRR78543.1 ABC transporter permease subunit [Planctomycetota bacterium]HRT96254.1 ABC transporter permease subunit [Planctomycetota bacterium]
MVESRGMRGLGRRATLYALLIGGSILFSIPFGWLLLSSFKTNDEQFRDPPTWLPRPPSAAKVSPYVARDEFDEIARPRACPRARWDEARPLLVEATRQAVKAAGLPPAAVPADALRDEAVEGIAFAAGQNVADHAWFESLETLRQKWLAQVTPNLIQNCRDRAYKRFLIGPIRAKSVEQQEEILRRDEPIAAVWQVQGGALAGQATEGRPCALLSYAFEKGANREATLTAVFPLSFPVERMKKLILSLRPDHSWNALDCTLEAEGQQWESAEPYNAGSDQWQELVWQFPSDDDTSMKVKSWIVLRPSGASGFAEPGRMRLTLTLRGRTRAEAWGTKLWNNFCWAFKHMPFWRYVAVSSFLCLMNIVGQLLGSSLAAYAFARLKWPGREFCFMLLLGTLMLPGAVTMVPSFLIFKNLGWYNTLLVLWVPSFCGSAFNIFLLRQFMRGIPKDLEDAAKIDGCSYLGVYRHVILPSIGPALAAIAIFTFMGSWNNFMGPLIFLNDQSKYPLALGIFGLQTQAGGNFGLIMAASALMALPVVIMFFFCQRYFIQGITLTGMKN